MVRSRATFGLACVLGLAACKSEPGGVGAACKADDQCAEGLACVEGACVAPIERPAVTPWCATLGELAGEWVFDTTVVGAVDLQSRGINGHYQLAVTLSGCVGQAQITKTGHDKTEYSDSKIQRSEAVLSESKRIPGAAELSVALKGKPTHTFTFVPHQGELFGFWQMTGDEWTRAGMWGYLRGTAAGDTLAKVEDFAAQPCEVACLTSCDVARREADQTLDTAGLGACLTACKAGESLPCPASAELPPALVLAVAGPAASLAEACTKIGETLGSGPVECNEQPVVGSKPVARKVEGKPLGGSFVSVRFVQVGFVGSGGYKGALHLLFESAAGWYWSGPIVDLSIAALGGTSLVLTDLDLRARDVLDARPGREVLADIGVEIVASDVAANEVETDETERTLICSSGEPPTCVIVTREWSSRRTLIKRKGDDPAKHPDLYEREGSVTLSVLPGDRLSVSTPAESRAEDRELAGIYAWP